MLAREIMENINGLWAKCYSKTLKEEEARLKLMENRDRTTRAPVDSPQSPRRTRTGKRPMHHYADMVWKYLEERPREKIKPSIIADHYGVASQLIGCGFRELRGQGKNVKKVFVSGNQYYYYGG